MSTLQTRTTPMLSKLDNSIENLLQKLQDILELSVINTESKSLETQAIETLQIESNTWTIIRLVDELLSVTRNLKENWILGHVPVIESNNTTTQDINTTNERDHEVNPGHKSNNNTTANENNDEDKYNFELKLKINQLLQDITGLESGVANIPNANANVATDNDVVLLSD